MKLWKLSYYPAEEENDSPQSFLYQLGNNSPKEAATIEGKLSTARSIEKFADWPPDWRKPIAKNHYQMTAGNHRVYYGLYESEIVVFYICRKKAQEAKRYDLNRARLNQEDFEKWRK
jgi:hypothetical protein